MEFKLVRSNKIAKEDTQLNIVFSPEIKNVCKFMYALDKAIAIYHCEKSIHARN